jgi:predicted anti-sigma-YlaC factor YlaD
MCPLSDDALLDWALAPREADPELVRHLQDCRACRERSQAVAKEQEKLRAAFAEPALPVGLARGLAAAPRSALWPRLGVAALLLLTVAVGVLLARTATHSTAGRRYRHAPLASIQSDLGEMAHRIAAARETLPEAEDQRTSAAYRELLSQEERLYIEGMAHYVGERSALTVEQEADFRRSVQEFYAVLGTRVEVPDASREFRGKVKALLNDEQYRAFEEFSRQGMEWQWKTDIALLMDDLSGELDLRFSEAERVRLALLSNYPHLDLPLLLADHCPPDPLVDNPTLSGAVRNSLDASYRRKFDSYLGSAKLARERAAKIVRQGRTPR